MKESYRFPVVNYLKGLMKGLTRHQSTEIAKKIATFIVMLDQVAFRNNKRQVYVTPYNYTFTNSGIVAFCDCKIETDDHYIIFPSKMYRIKDVSDGALLGIAAHEVRHRFQKSNPNCLFTEEYLNKKNILKPSAIANIKKINKHIENYVLANELDAMVIEESIRNFFRDQSFDQVLEGINYAYGLVERTPY